MTSQGRASFPAQVAGGAPVGSAHLEMADALPRLYRPSGDTPAGPFVAPNPRTPILSEAQAPHADGFLHPSALKSTTRSGLSGVTSALS